MSVKISGLPTVTTVADTDIVPVVAGGVTSNIAVSKLLTRPSGSSTSFTTGSFISFGSTPATTGAVRFSSGYRMLATRNASNTADEVAVASDTSDNLILGAANTTSSQAYPQAFVNPSSAGYLMISGVAYVKWGGSKTLYYQPMVQGNSASFDTGMRTPNTIGSDVFFFVSGSANRPTATDPERHVAVFGGDVFLSGSVSGSTVAIFGANGVTFTDKRNNITTDSVTVSQYNAANFVTPTNTGGPCNSNFTFAVNANEFWEIEFFGTVASTVAAGLRFAVMAPTGSVLDGWWEGVTTTTGSQALATVMGMSRIASPNTLTAGSYVTAANFTGSVNMWSSVLVGGTGGNVTIALGVGPGGSGTGMIVSGSYFRARRATAV